jgi:uncharacterized protein (DUF433 family)
MSTLSDSVATEFAHIVCTPDILRGEPRIDGEQIRVREIAEAHLAGNSPEEIAADVFPALTLAQVFAALAYYEDHRDEMQRCARERAASLERFHLEACS